MTFFSSLPASLPVNMPSAVEKPPLMFLTMTAHFSLGRSFRANAFSVCCVFCVSVTGISGLINMPGMWTHLSKAPVSPLNCHLFLFCFDKPVSFPVSRLQEICDNPKFIVGKADRTDICQGQLGRYSSYLHKSCCVVPTHIFHSFTHDAPVCHHRGLLAPGSHCIFDPQKRCPGPSRPPWPGLWPQIRRHLSLPGTSPADWLQTDEVSGDGLLADVRPFDSFSDISVSVRKEKIKL